MTIGEKIKHLRQTNNITQEKLAEYLNISSQSISKWENNNALPDISLVVPIANFFGVSMDELFDRNADMQAAEIEEYDEKDLELANKGYVDKRLALWREAVQKYPRNFHCLNCLASSLFHTLFSPGFDHEESEQNAKELIAICERILQDCTDNDIRNSATQLLVYTYSTKWLSIKSEEKAVEYANMAGNIHTCREVLLEGAYYTEEGKKKAQEQKHSNNLCFMDSLCNNIIYLATDRSPEEEIFACETAIKLWTTLIYDNNFLFYHCRIADIYSHLARSHAKLEHREETLESLQKAFEHAKKYDEIPAGSRHFTSVFLSLASSDSSKTTKNFKETQTELIQRQLENATYDFMRNDAAFIALQQ